MATPRGKNPPEGENSTLNMTSAQSQGRSKDHSQNRRCPILIRYNLSSAKVVANHKTRVHPPHKYNRGGEVYYKNLWGFSPGEIMMLRPQEGEFTLSMDGAWSQRERVYPEHILSPMPSLPSAWMVPVVLKCS